MLRLAGMESGGFHLRGTSSMGKTTALRVAASVWGRPSYMQRWRTTDNALEATAVQHCDSLLILDEFGQLDPRVAGETAYLLANDAEKSRNTRGGLNRKRRTWRLLFLSSGEVSLADHMAEAGRRTQAGMEVRMVDVPLDAGAGMGGLEATHGHDGPAQLADAITGAAARHYGTAGRAWLEWACQHHEVLPQRLQELTDRYRADMVPEAASEQVRRVGSRFALVAAAGELASEADITGWPAGHAAWGVRQCFEAWLGARGHLDNGEDAAMLRQVRAWLEKNGDALLTYTHRAMDDHKPATPLRAGFKRLIDEHGKPVKIDAATEYVDKLSAAESSEIRNSFTEFFIFPEAFRREVCKGFEVAAVAKVLKSRGHLVHEPDRLTGKQRLPGIGPAPVYHIKPSIFADEL
jgi:putative DNA primase/helicase